MREEAKAATHQDANKHMFQKSASPIFLTNDAVASYISRWLHPLGGSLVRVLGVDAVQDYG